MVTTAPLSESGAASNTQTEHSTTTHSMPSQTTRPPEWRQATAYVGDNPDRAREPRVFRKYQPVRVSRVNNGGYETVEATVSEFTENGGLWYYQLKDSNGAIVWRDSPTWFAESQISAS